MTQELCNHRMRGGTCNMDAGHRGRHTTRAWYCEGCGKLSRGTPAGQSPSGAEDNAPMMKFCFMCVEKEKRTDPYGFSFNDPYL